MKTSLFVVKFGWTKQKRISEILKLEFRQGVNMRALFESPAGLLLLLLVIVLFGAKKMPDAARSLGRSIRIFKSEMDTPNSDKKGSAPGTSPDSASKDSI